jgi:predicted N-formylglutamate amidohydrolase
MFDRIVFSCEHARNRIPVRYADMFSAAVLEGHRGYDPGALDVARALARRLGAPLFSGMQSRLLVDLNRSTGHSGLFSEHTRGLNSGEKTVILERYYHPYRRRVEKVLRGEISLQRSVLRISVHSFTPELDGRVRRADIGILYDPGRSVERRSSTRIRDRLQSIDPTIVLRRNYPYRGIADGFTTHLRKALRSDCYAGIEIELNQARIAGECERRQVATVLEQAIRAELGSNGRKTARPPAVDSGLT